MKKLFTLLFAFAYFSANAQMAENIIIVTTDGLRWQEVFKGMDSSIAKNSKFNQGDSDFIFKKYWASSEKERRKKLMPFLWNTVEAEGQLYGNRIFGNKVDNANPYWFSYPGYNEIFTGFPDTAINSNEYQPNPHSNFLEFLNKQAAWQNKVVAYGSWNAFDRILNEERSKFPVHSAFDSSGGKHPTAIESLQNNLLKDSYRPFADAECLDVFTHYAALNYIKTKHPKIIYISYGETDEWAHSGRYKDYLEAAFMVDKWIRDLWEYVQQEPLYKNKTALFITTDHGRGDIIKDEWTSHNNKIQDASQIWFATMGPGIKPKGELKNEKQLYQKQFAQTICNLLDVQFKAEHPIAPAIMINE